MTIAEQREILTRQLASTHSWGVSAIGLTLFSTKHCRLVNNLDNTRRAIDTNGLAGFQLLCDVLYPNHSWDSILSRNHRSVGH